MKKLILATAIALATGTATAEPFEFEKAWGSPDLDPSLGNPKIEFAPIDRPGPVVTSLEHIYKGNPDGMGDTRHWDGLFTPSAPFAISLYEIYRGNPDGGGYESYYARFPADTDWDRLAREHRGGAKQTARLARNEK